MFQGSAMDPFLLKNIEYVEWFQNKVTYFLEIKLPRFPRVYMIQKMSKN